jgi:tetratricopeptide (TPR) repeat protein
MAPAHAPEEGAPRRCPNCGRLIPRGTLDCPHCPPGTLRRPHDVEAVLLGSLLILGLLFAVTGFATRLYHAQQKAIAQQWFARGQQELRAGRADRAVADFRTALVYQRDNSQIELRLAQALATANRTDEARSYLEDLRSREPENGPVNLELGRLAARQGDLRAALTYYHSAIYGDWAGQDAAPERRAARLELYHFLMSHGATAEAQAELMTLAATLPPDPNLHAEVGQLFLDAGENDQALKEFQSALQEDRHNLRALVGAGEAEFRLGRYSPARAYLERALRYAPRNPEIVRRFQIANAVLSLDPYAPGLPAAVRGHRVAEAFRLAMARLTECARAHGESLGGPEKGTPLESLYGRGARLRPRVKEPALRRDPDLITAVMDWVADVETLTASYCGPAQGLDEALVLVVREHGGA